MSQPVFKKRQSQREIGAITTENCVSMNESWINNYYEKVRGESEKKTFEKTKRKVFIVRV